MRREFVCGTGAPAVQPLFTQTETHLERVIRRWNCKCFYFCLSMGENPGVADGRDRRNRFGFGRGARSHKKGGVRHAKTKRVVKNRHARKQIS